MADKALVFIQHQCLTLESRHIKKEKEMLSSRALKLTKNKREFTSPSIFPVYTILFLFNTPVIKRKSNMYTTCSLFIKYN